VAYQDPEQDSTIFETLARDFSERTAGVFAPKAPSATGPTPIKLCRMNLHQKLKKREGVLELNGPAYKYASFLSFVPIYIGLHVYIEAGF
jgi:hypothetical protein